MNIFITGATGYIGHKLLIAALEKGYGVHALVRNISRATVRHPGLKYFEGDVTEASTLDRAMTGCSTVLHCAGITQFWHRDPSQFYRVNVTGTKNVLDAAVRQRIEKFVFTSSCAVLGPSYAKPLTEDDLRTTSFENDYELSKYAAEELVKEYARHGLSAVIVAPPRVYGPGEETTGNPITRLIRRCMQSPITFIPAAGNVRGHYAFIDDVVDGHFLAMEKGMPGEKYILGGENVSYAELFDHIRNISSSRTTYIPVPRVMLKAASGLAFIVSKLTGRHTHLTPKVVDRLFQNRELSCEKAVRELGYVVTPFTEGIRKTIQYLKALNHV